MYASLLVIAAAGDMQEFTASIYAHDFAPVPPIMAHSLPTRCSLESRAECLMGYGGERVLLEEDAPMQCDCMGVTSGEKE
jgi:hypothetical protein